MPFKHLARYTKIQKKIFLHFRNYHPYQWDRTTATYACLHEVMWSNSSVWNICNPLTRLEMMPRFFPRQWVVQFCLALAWQKRIPDHQENGFQFLNGFACLLTIWQGESKKRDEIFDQLEAWKTENLVKWWVHLIEIMTTTRYMYFFSLSANWFFLQEV